MFNLEIPEIELVHYNTVNKDYQHDSSMIQGIHLFQINRLLNYQIFQLKIFIFKKK